MCLLNQVGYYASSVGTLSSPLLTLPFCEQQDRHCSSESCSGGRGVHKAWERPLQVFFTSWFLEDWKTVSLNGCRLLYTRGWKSPKMERKISRKRKKIPTNRNRLWEEKARLLVDTCILQNTERWDICVCAASTHSHTSQTLILEMENEALESRAEQIQIICASSWIVKSENGPRCVWERTWAVSAAGPRAEGFSHLKCMISLKRDVTRNVYDA